MSLRRLSLASCELDGATAAAALRAGARAPGARGPVGQPAHGRRAASARRGDRGRPARHPAPRRDGHRRRGPRGPRADPKPARPAHPHPRRQRPRRRRRHGPRARLGAPAPAGPPGPVETPASDPRACRPSRPLPLSSSWETLVLAHGNLGDRAAEAITEGNGFLCLHALDLSNNEVGLAGSAALANAATLPGLVRLDLSRNALSGAVDVHSLAKRKGRPDGADLRRGRRPRRRAGRALLRRALRARYPTVRPLFAGVAMSRQHQHLVSALSLVVEHLRRPDALAQTLHDMGPATHRLRRPAEPLLRRHLDPLGHPPRRGGRRLGQTRSPTPGATGWPAVAAAMMRAHLPVASEAETRPAP